MKPAPFDPLDTPVPPPWWNGVILTLGLAMAVLALAKCCTSCVCTLTFRPDVPAAIRIIENISAK